MFLFVQQRYKLYVLNDFFFLSRDVIRSFLYVWKVHDNERILEMPNRLDIFSSLRQAYGFFSFVSSLHTLRYPSPLFVSTLSSSSLSLSYRSRRNNINTRKPMCLVSLSLFLVCFRYLSSVHETTEGRSHSFSLSLSLSLSLSHPTFSLLCVYVCLLVE